MTLMVGTVLADGSAAVLASDSMTHEPMPGMPGYRQPVMRSKIREALAQGKVAGAYVSSPEWAVGVQLFFQRASIGYAVGNIPAAQPDPARAAPGRRGWIREPELMIACWTPGSRVALGYSSAPRGCEWAGGDSGRGAVFVGGTAKAWASETAYVAVLPQTLADAERLMVDIAQRTIEWWYREDDCRALNDYLARGTLPPIALPVQTATLQVGRSDVTRKEWAECLTA
jgi:hypothetical protein